MEPLISFSFNLNLISFSEKTKNEKTDEISNTKRKIIIVICILIDRLWNDRIMYGLLERLHVFQAKDNIAFG